MAVRMSASSSTMSCPRCSNELVETVGKVNIDKMTVIDGGQGGSSGGIGKVVNQLPGAVISLAEQIETATGVNILSQFKDKPAQNIVIQQPESGTGGSVPNPESGSEGTETKTT